MSSHSEPEVPEIAQIASKEQSPVDPTICPWCKKLLEQPRQLDCGHNFCTSCLELWYSFSILQSFDVCTSKISIPADLKSDNEQLGHKLVEVISCPECQKPTSFQSNQSISSAFQLNENLNEKTQKIRSIRESIKCGWCEEQEATQECSKCEVLYCEQCKKETHSRPAFESHQFYPKGELELSKFKTCDKHKGRRKDIFCRLCQESICLYCNKFEVTHKDHPLSSFPEANKEYQQSLEALVSQYQYAYRELLSFEQTLERVTLNLKQGLETMEEQIRSSFAQVRKLVEARENQLISFAQNRTAQDLKLGELLQNSIRNVKNYAERTIASYPRDAQDPSVFRDYKAELQRLIRALEDVQMETSLSPMKFGFELNKFVGAIESAGAIVEQLDLGQVSSNVMNAAMIEQVTFWLSKEMAGRKECTLVYRASHNGWSDQKFIEIAEKLSEPSLIVGRTETGYVFGGFQMTPRRKSNSFSGKESFLFSLDNGNQRNAILLGNLYRADVKNFQFSAKDLSFQLNSKTAVSQLGNSFVCPPDQNPDTLLLGAPQVKLLELEMFAIGNPPTQGPKMQEILRGSPHLKKALTEFVGQQYLPSNLLYKASRDGWFANVFHERCDDKGATLVIAKSEYGNIFGGFSKMDWGGKHISFKGFITDPNAFLFSLTDGQGREPVVLKLKSPSSAMQNDFRAGPCYGAGSDLRLNLNEQTVQCNPRSYLIPSTHRQDTFLAGHALARLDEVEVYAISS